LAFRKRSISKADSFDGNTEVSFGETQSTKNKQNSNFISTGGAQLENPRKGVQILRRSMQAMNNNTTKPNLVASRGIGSATRKQH
jgi:hypothetical protein